MKKFLVVLLSLGLLVAFGATASAADVKFSGSYYVAGAYANNAQLADVDKTYSRAFFYQRIQIQPVFQIAEGLTFTTRFVALEKQWGQTDWRGGVDDNTSSAALSDRRQTTVAGNPKIHENIEIERGYVGFKTAIGLIEVGYMSDGAWGTAFGNLDQSRPKIKLTSQFGPMIFGAGYCKEFESDTSLQTTVIPAGKHYANADSDDFVLLGIYNWSGGNAGLLYKYWDRAATRPVSNYRANYHALLPYIKATFGPVYLEGELFYALGKIAKFDSGATPDQDIDGLGAYIKAQVNLGPAYFGGSVLYSQGNDLTDTTKAKIGPGSQDLDVGLILGNDQLQTWENSTGNGGANGVSFDSGKTNAIMFSFFGGFNPSPKLNLELMVVSASRDTAAMSRTGAVITSAVSKNLGIEFDATAKYKIYDNLSYMVGAGYLWTGDYFKGSNSANVVGNDYLLMNKLTLSF